MCLFPKHRFLLGMLTKLKQGHMQKHTNTFKNSVKSLPSRRSESDNVRAGTHDESQAKTYVFSKPYMTINVSKIPKCFCFFQTLQKMEDDIITVTVVILLNTAFTLIKKRKKGKQTHTETSLGEHNAQLHELCLEDPRVFKTGWISNALQGYWIL